MGKLIRSPRRLTAALLLLGLVAGTAAWAAAVPRQTVEIYPPEMVDAPLGDPEDYDPSYDYDAPVPASQAVEVDWFADAAFLGDSLTDGLLLYTDLSKAGADNLAYQALNVVTITYQRVIRRNGRMVTPLKALEGLDCGKVYISLGINEMNWYDDQKYYDHYAALIDQIRELQPGADVYIQTLLPVTAAKSADTGHVTNDGILRFNGLIAKLASEKRAYLVDPYSVFVGEDGTLPAGWSTDGLHLTREKYGVWLDYLRTHTM